MSDTSRTAAISGFLIAGALLLGVSFYANRDTGDALTLPALRILVPRHDDTVATPLTLRFTTPADLQLTPQGWTAGDLHVHLLIDGVELMPAAADITRADSAFDWRLPALPPGEHLVFLTWAARHHGNVGGSLDTVRFVVRP